MVENGGCFIRLRARVFSSFQRSRAEKNRAMTAANAREHQQQEQQEQQEKSNDEKKAFVTEGEKILRLLSSRVERAVRAATGERCKE